MLEALSHCNRCAAISVSIEKRERSDAHTIASPFRGNRYAADRCA